MSNTFIDLDCLNWYVCVCIIFEFSKYSTNIVTIQYLRKLFLKYYDKIKQKKAVQI